MCKRKLQEITKYKLMDVKDCLNALGWTYTEREHFYDNIKCSCGKEVEIYGFFGAENLFCLDCGKEIVDMTSPVRTSNSTYGMIDTDKFEIEGNKYWIAKDGNGGILYEE